MKFIEFDPASLSSQEMSHLLNGVVVPRPIAWVSTVDVDGSRNLAPHSYFNAVSCEPPIVQFTSTHSSPYDPAGHKDTLRNVQATGEFVVNIVSEELLEAMNATAIDSPPGVDEFQLARLQALASTRVRPPRVASAKIALECRVRMLMPMGDATMIFGDVLLVHVRDDVWADGRVRYERLKAVGRLGGSNYAPFRGAVTLRRPHWSEHTQGTERVEEKRATCVAASADTTRE
jgi:flavin reductase (DIM6/NTAB) family NADH-FMN oxidoreductase RutF